MAENINVNVNNFKVKMPTYNGKGGRVVAAQFLADFEGWAGMSQLDDATKAYALNYALEGEAKTWLWKLTSEGREGINDYTTLKPLFTTRFKPPLSSDALAREVNNLKQKPNESVGSLADRCGIVQSLRDELNPIPAGDDQATRQAKQAQVQAVHDTLVKELFVSNLRPELHDKVISQTHLVTLADYIRAAQMEDDMLTERRSRHSNPSASTSSTSSTTRSIPMAELVTDEDQGYAEIAALSDHLASLKKRFPGWKKRRTASAIPPQGYVCNICRIAGHWISDCPQRKPRPPREQSKDKDTVKKSTSPPPSKPVAEVTELTSPLFQRPNF